MKRVVVIANKWWECDAALLAMLSDNVRALGSPWPEQLQPTRPRPNPASLPPENQNPLPRAVFPFRNHSAEFWCLSDLLEHLPSSLQSSTEQKANVLPRIFSKGPNPDLVISLGTASTPYDGTNENGNVVVGTKVFLHNGHPGGTNPNSNWTVGPFDQLLESPCTREWFDSLKAFDVQPVCGRFLAVPLSSAPTPRALLDFDYVALGTLNVTNYAEYSSLDPLTVQSFGGGVQPGVGASLETTHGLIRVLSSSPYVFVSGITDRARHFDDDVTPRSHGQNTAAAHNAGAVTSWLLARLDQIL
jgi:hypothetical protein